MQERYVGRSGLRVSALALGTRTWGAGTDVEDAGDQLRAFLDAGGTLLDTAASYADGLSEQVLGQVLAHDVARHDVVLVTKAGGGLGGPGPDGSRPRPDTSARAMLASLDRSLRRLGTDHVDLWMAHAWDAAVPVAETQRALQSAVDSGRARYAGVADHTGWQLATAASAAAPAGAPLVAAATELSLLQRAASAEVMPAAAHHGLGVLAWAPLGRGVLSGKYRPAPARRGRPPVEATEWVQPYLGEGHRRVVEAVVTAAKGLDAPPAAVALAWVLGLPGVTAAVLGARTCDQLQQCLEHQDLTLPEEIRGALDEVSACLAASA